VLIKGALDRFRPGRCESNIIVRKSDDLAMSDSNARIPCVRKTLPGLERVAEIFVTALDQGPDYLPRSIARIIVNGLYSYHTWFHVAKALYGPGVTHLPGPWL